MPDGFLELKCFACGAKDRLFPVWFQSAKEAEDLRICEDCENDVSKTWNCLEMGFEMGDLEKAANLPSIAKRRAVNRLKGVT